MELLHIVDENNELTGQVEERKIVHEKCLWHRHVSSWIMNKNGETVLTENFDEITQITASGAIFKANNNIGWWKMAKNKSSKNSNNMNKTSKTPNSMNNSNSNNANSSNMNSNNANKNSLN